MATQTDFKTWLGALDTDEYQDVYCLYKAVDEVEEWGAFKCSEKNTSHGKMYFVKCTYIDEVLMLGSEKAKNYFLDTIREKYTDGMDIESYYGYKYGLEKED